ncbi:NAD(P)/FAD-dependent oxidoreductase [Nesterenkonia aerolata]|uniref:FAD/NAD(P)-binding oxidoreductase n=1 Tax=Nesterenkonia aerolata TaxID=3074079 RepID=A0ABU2DT67_9MICC|nr:FAD/NAD(P)-binding oxidoreductase [Nesterenkonia sp. LY-0111]MDR8019480.1 FAD/NAD(P)-binding oxidoreductase [Nesterenkonia sp. LY-0111]
MSTPPLAPEGHLLIVGAGLAGYHTARGVRAHGHTGPITIFGEEHRPAYDRPALSKAYLTGAVAEEDLLLDDPEDPLDVIWISGVGVVSLSTDPLGVITQDGVFHPGDAVVITTGASALGLPSATAEETPEALPYVLRNMEDALALRDTDLRGTDVVVVGGGFLALEAAATCMDRGAGSVTVAAGEAYPGSRRLGEPVGEAIRRAHEARGVEFAPPSRAQAIRRCAGDQGQSRYEVLLADGQALAADIVICAIGAEPRTEWLLDAPVQLCPHNGAVLCDDTGATAVPGVYAAGDCAQWASHSSGLRPVGHWQEAFEEAAVVAAALTGAAPVALQEPYFWSDQFNLRIQGVGRIHLADEVTVVDGTPEGADLLVHYSRQGENVGILGINRLRDVTRWRRSSRIRPAAREVPARETVTV